MPLNQRKIIAEAIEGKWYVEWGMGGTTMWLAKHANPYRAACVEHSEGWAEASGFLSLRRSGEIGDNWTIDLAPCTPGQNATIAEEGADDAVDYIHCGVSRPADIYLIDGVVRGDCLRALVATGRPMTVFIHDTHRDWYDDAIAEAVAAGFKRTDYPEGDDYPGCLLTRLEKK